MKEVVRKRTVDVEDVKKRILEGEIYKSIGESYGVTKQAIAKIARKEGIAGAGIEVRQKQRLGIVQEVVEEEYKTNNSKRKIPIGEEEVIKTRLLKGEIFRTIAEDYNVSRERIRQIAKKFKLNRYGLILRRNGQLEAYRAKMKKKYGQFWTDGFIDKSDFLYACKIKFTSKQNSAKQVGTEWNIEFDDIEWVTHCPIFGIELNYFPDGSRQENSVSFDRLDHTKGYIKGNVFICSWRANRIKNNGTAEEHKKIYEYLLQHSSK